MELTGKRRSHDSYFGTVEQNSANSRSYSFGRTARPDFQPHDPMPLFLSDPDSEPDPLEFTSPSEQRRKTGLVTRIVAGVVAVSAVAAVVVLLQSEVGRMLVASAKASITAVTADQSDTQPAFKEAVVRQIPSKDPGRVSSPLVMASSDANEQASAPPSREAIATAYQSALQGKPPVAAPQAAPQAAAPQQQAAVAPTTVAPEPAPVRTLDADTLASLMKRARDLIAVGDISAARLFLERAANSQDATAAFLLAQTYDPAVLGTRDTRSITPDPAMAREWYQKAARLGSSEAQTRLSQLKN
jgi:hypothetical protein